MTNIYGKAGLVLLGLLAAQPALASDKQDFVTCDGRKHPGKRDDGMRGEANRGGFESLFGARPSVPSLRIDACTRALASPRLLPGQSLRRAHLLRARAAAHIEANDSANALADLDLADTATAALRDDPFFRRSMGASMVLLRALAKAQAGEADAARALAAEAAAARPYSLDVQLVAASIRHGAGQSEANAPSIWLPVTRLEPATAALALNLEAEAGNWAAVRALRPAVRIAWPETAPSLLQLVADDGSDFLSSMMVALNSSYALAATGDGAGARRELADLERTLSRFRAEPAAAEAEDGGVSANGLLLRVVDQHTKQVEARMAITEGRYDDAVALVVASEMPRNAAALELAAALRAAAPAGSTVVIPELADSPEEQEAGRVRRLAGLAVNALIAPESPRAMIDYERSRPNILGELVGAAVSMGTTLLDGIDRLDGFRSTDNPDGTIKVEFVGNTPSRQLVQEMTLLRAAEVTRMAGKPGFVIVDRKDYTRLLQTTQNGIPISSTPQGFKTELTIRHVEAGAEPARAFDAVAVIDALGPVYYEDAKPRVAAR